jgi:hypothetical protein
MYITPLQPPSTCPARVGGAFCRHWGIPVKLDCWTGLSVERLNRGCIVLLLILVSACTQYTYTTTQGPVAPTPVQTPMPPFVCSVTPPEPIPPPDPPTPIPIPCQAASLEGGPWAYVSSGVDPDFYPGCPGMQVQWDSATGQGTVISSPPGCIFQVGDVKWAALDTTKCTIADFLRSQFSCGYTRGDLIDNATAARLQATELTIDSEFRDIYRRVSSLGAVPVRDRSRR